MSLPKFTKLGNAYSVLTFEKARFVPINEPIIPNQVLDVSGGNQAKVTDLGGNEKFYYIIINRVSETQHDNLLGFLADSTVNYRENSFTFTDENSSDYTVRLWQQEIDIPKVKGGLYNINLIVRVEV